MSLWDSYLREQSNLEFYHENWEDHWEYFTRNLYKIYYTIMV